MPSSSNLVSKEPAGAVEGAVVGAVVGAFEGAFVEGSDGAGAGSVPFVITLAKLFPPLFTLFHCALVPAKVTVRLFTPEKAPRSICLKDAGSAIEVRAEQPEKASSPISLNPYNSEEPLLTVTVVSDRQLAKARSLISSTLPGIVTSVSPVLANVPSSMSIKESGREIDLRFWQPLKAPSPISLTPSGTTTLVTPLLMKAPSSISITL